MANTERSGDTARPLLDPGVLWYRDDDRSLVLIASRSFDPQRLRLASEFDIQLLASCDGEHDVEALATKLAVPTERVVRTLARWDQEGDGLLDWLGLRDPSPQARQRRVAREAEALEMLRECQAGQELRTDNVGYHTETIQDALEQFEEVEATVSHAFSVEHPALGGRSYSGAFCDAVVDGARLPKGARVLEIGCGTGRFARGFLDRLRERHGAVYETVQYTLFDLSPRLQDSQRQECAPHEGRTRFVLGNAEEHDFGEERFDLVLANEMLADLSLGRARAENVRRQRAESDAERVMLAYGLSADNAPPEFVVNIGAIRVVERLAALLSDAGTAALTEYSSEGVWPTSVELRGHTEFSIHFGHLCAVAQRCGLEADLRPLGEWMGFDRHWEVLSFEQLALLSDEVLPFLGQDPLPTLAYDPSMLRTRLGDQFDRLGNLDFRPLEQWDELNPFCSFRALLLRR